MVKDMLLKRDTEFNQVLHLYSAHDTTIAPFLNALGIYNWLPPPLACAVLVEMREKNEKYIVTVSIQKMWWIEFQFWKILKSIKN